MLGLFFGTLGASLLGNILTGKEVKSKIPRRGVTRAGKGTITAGEDTIRTGEGTIRAGQNF